MDEGGEVRKSVEVKTAFIERCQRDGMWRNKTYTASSIPVGPSVRGVAISPKVINPRFSCARLIITSLTPPFQMLCIVLMPFAVKGLDIDCQLRWSLPHS